ncbi:DUF2750 domain-containing protein [Alkalimonas collagenimarina]|uniref:DUF2750 domain-containing protein n=1 Tax=Alkalimonas collagenimarina TaxID=400390 RepID=A0ABT9GV08_9GAMM|nr:DUF2750 domain-containing protein [Alkalimonas collagenimarina]MDP4534868.1 DUF2750 domain-containing protein [Alkalimonas collagenimarina]
MTDVIHDPQYQKFVEEAKTTAVVWALAEGEDLLVVESVEFEETDVIPFWSTEADAQKQCSDEWAAYKPEAIPLDVFCDGWLKEMYDDGLLIGTNWDDELNGPEVEPKVLLTALRRVQ